MTAHAASARPPFPRWLVALLGALGVGYLLYLLRGVLTPVIVAFLIAYVLDPTVDRLERWRIPRALGISLVLLVAVALLGAMVLLILPGVIRELAQFASELPAQLEQLYHRAEPWLAERGIHAPASLRDALDQTGVNLSELAGKAAAPAGKIVGAIAGGTASALGAAVGLLIIPVLAFYLLYDFDRITAGIRDLVPARLRPRVVEIAREIDSVLGQFVRGQLLVMLAVGVLYSVSYALIGLRLAVPIGVTAGLLAFIPYVGGAAAICLGLLMCLLQGASWAQVVAVVAAYALIQVLEGFVIVPRVMEAKVGLSSIWVLLGMMVFGELFGFFGVLLAVPAAAVTKIFVVRALAQYRQSELYLAKAPAADAAHACSPAPGVRPPSADSRMPTAESRPPRPDGRPPMAERRAPTAERRRPNADSRMPTAESRPPMAERRPPTAAGQRSRDEATTASRKSRRRRSTRGH